MTDKTRNWQEDIEFFTRSIAAFKSMYLIVGIDE